MKKALRRFARKLSAFMDKWGEDYNMTCVRDTDGTVWSYGLYELPDDGFLA